MVTLELEAHHARVETKIVGDQDGAAQSSGEGWKDLSEHWSELHHSSGYSMNTGRSDIPFRIDQRVVLVLSFPSLGIKRNERDLDDPVMRAKARRLDIDDDGLRALCENVMEI